MKIQELLNELTFQGSPCTKDCSGHAAGYRYGMQHQLSGATLTPSPSFDKGTGIAAGQIASKRIVRPKVRNPQGRFAANPRIR